MSAASEPPALPRRYGKYELLERIGEGGMAEAFKARLTGAAGFEKTVVIKRILPHLAESDRFVKMFINEAKLAARLQHQNVVQVFELGEVESSGELFMAMEYVQGLDLRAILQLAAERVLRIPIWFSAHALSQVLLGLAHAHELIDEDGEPLAIIHRDVTPSNVFVSVLGEIKLADFGVAKAIGSMEPESAETTLRGQLKGKISYAPPEQIHGEALDARADIFSAGVVLWECLTQRRLFGGRADFETMLAICEEPRTPPSAFNPGVPPELDAFVLRALERDREDRYANARDFATDLSSVVQQLRPRLIPADMRHVLDVVRGRRSVDPLLGADLAAPPDTLGDPVLLTMRRNTPNPPAAASPASRVAYESGGVWMPEPPAGIADDLRMATPPPLAPDVRRVTMTPTVRAPEPPLGLEGLRPGMTPAPDSRSPPPQAEAALLSSLHRLDTPAPGRSGVPRRGPDPRTSDAPTVPPRPEPSRSDLSAQRADAPPPRATSDASHSGPVMIPPAASTGRGRGGTDDLPRWEQEAEPASSAPYFGAYPFFARTSDGSVRGPLEYATFARLLETKEARGASVSVDGDRWTPATTFASLAGLDALARDRPRLRNATVVGTLEETSLIHVFARLALGGSTGRLVVMTGANATARRDVEIVRGAPSDVWTDRPDLQLPALAVRRDLVTREQLPALVHCCLAQEIPLDEAIRALTNASGRYRPIFMRDRLVEVLRWRVGRFALDARPIEGPPFAASLLTGLVDLVARAWTEAELLARLDGIMTSRLTAGPDLEAVLTGLELAKGLEAMVERLIDGKSLATLSRRSASVPLLALGMVLIETGAFRARN